MLFRSHTPQPPLTHYVDSLWYYEGDPPKHTAERVLPNGAMQLIINLGQDVLRAYNGENVKGPLVAGAYSEAVIIDPAQLACVMGVSFRPGGAMPFLAAPSSILHNQDAALSEFWGNLAAELREQLLQAPSVKRKFEVLEKSLLSRAAAPSVHHAVVSHAIHRLHHVPLVRSVADVVDETGYSHARFIRIFHDHVGLTPKMFCRIQRFQAVLRRAYAGRGIDWSRVALDCGYFDKAHFNRDFRAFSGMNPSAYLASRGEFQNHVAILD